MEITTKGQVTIPQRLREQFGLTPETEVTFEATELGVPIRAAHSREEELGRRLARATGSATVPISTDGLKTLTSSASWGWALQ